MLKTNRTDWHSHNFAGRYREDSGADLRIVRTAAASRLSALPLSIALAILVTERVVAASVVLSEKALIQNVHADKGFRHLKIDWLFSFVFDQQIAGSFIFVNKFRADLLGFQKLEQLHSSQIFNWLLSRDHLPSLRNRRQSDQYEASRQQSKT